MKPFIQRWGHNVTVLDSNRPSCGISEKYYDKRKLQSTNIVKSEQTRKSKDDKIILSDIDSNITSISKSHEQCFNFKRPSLKSHAISSCNEETIKSSKSVFTNVRDDTYESYDGANSALSTSSIVYESDESFLPIETYEKHIGLSAGFKNPKDNLSFLRPLRVFNKYGKPLTDRVGRPLMNILGEQLLIFNDDAKVFSDSKGKQVFNCLGESAIYSTTNLHIPPTDDEPGIPVMDIDKKHILFLYDNKGHPLTDSLGRPLNKASGRLMFGMDSAEKIKLNNYKYNQLKSMYSKAPLENFVRRVQIFDSDFRPLTDEHGRLFKSAKIICNKSGMPMSDINGKQLYFKYGARIITETHTNTPEIKESFFNTPSNSSEDSIVEKDIFDKLGCKGNEVIDKLINASSTNSLECRLNIEDKEEEMYKNSQNNRDTLKNGVPKVVNYKELYDKKDENKLFEGKTCKDIQMNDSTLEIEYLTHSHKMNKKSLDKDINVTHSKHFEVQGTISDNVGNTREKSPYFSYMDSNSKNLANDELEQKQRNSNLTNIISPNKNYSKEAIVLFDASKKMARQKSSMCTMTDLKNKRRRIGHIVKRKSNKKVYTSNFIEYIRNALNISHIKQNNNQIIFNDYGKPMKDIYGNVLYDKFGIPLTGANGIRLSEKARHTLRLKLKNIPVLPVGKVNKECGQNMARSLSYNKSYDQFGDPFYDKYGRPLYDLFGKLIYDIYGRPLTDAFGRPLIDAIGQPLMDADGNVLTSVSNSVNFTLTDIFGRRLYDKRGKALFDSYGRPRFDIFTVAIYDSCGRPATDGNGNILFDFLNKPIQPYPEKPLYKNARILLPKYIDRILAMPSMHRVLKYSRATLKDVFGGPLFDDFGKPLYNKFGKPLYDKYGRPLYDKDGRPLCDCYGRPLSEEIRESPNDQTLSVVDSLKLLKLTKESSKWMEIKQSQSRGLKTSSSSILDDAIVMRVVQPTKHKSTQYTYALTRVTRFSCGRQALEILEAPLSPSTASEMHNLPVDNKPLLMVARQRKRIVKKHRIIKQR